MSAEEEIIFLTALRNQIESRIRVLRAQREKDMEAILVEVQS